MNLHADEAIRLRIENGVIVDSMSQIERDPSLGMPSLVVRTKTLSHYPTLAQAFYACSPLTVLGIEVEGGSGSLSVATSTLFALNLGSAIPPTGTNVIATFVENRWVFRYDG
jgi:hypothetical protein